MRNSILRVSALIMIFAAIFTFVACGNDNDDTPNGMQKLTNEFVDYTLYVPVSWTADTSNGFISAYTNDKSNVSVLTMTSTRVYNTIDEYIDEYLTNLQATFADFAYNEEESVRGQELTLGGKPAARIAYTLTLDGTQYKYLQTIAANGVSIYTVTYTAIAENYDAHIDEVYSILDNFKF